MGKSIPSKQAWVTFVNAADCPPGTVASGFQYGQEIAIANDAGKYYAVPVAYRQGIQTACGPDDREHVPGAQEWQLHPGTNQHQCEIAVRAELLAWCPRRTGQS